MSEFENERVMANARAMSVEDVKVFLTQVDRKLLVGELDRRLEEAERRDSALADLVKRYEKRND
jgi:hypothetical protein